MVDGAVDVQLLGGAFAGELAQPAQGQLDVAIGPEGGWIPYEVDLLGKAGLKPVQLGDRILRVETAVTALLSRIF